MQLLIRQKSISTEQHFLDASKHSISVAVFLNVPILFFVELTSKINKRKTGLLTSSVQKAVSYNDSIPNICSFFVSDPYEDNACSDVPPADRPGAAHLHLTRQTLTILTV